MTDTIPSAEPSPATGVSPVRLPPARVRTRPQPAAEPAAAAAIPDDQSGSADTRDCEVGYGRPPKHTRFRKGQSGNPRGRPKGAKGLNTIVRESLTQKVAVRTAAGEKRMPLIEALVHKTLEQAMKGNSRMLFELLKLYASAVPEEKPVVAEEKQDDGLSAADEAILAAFLQQASLEQEEVQ